jgi:chromate transporter
LLALIPVKEPQKHKADLLSVFLVFLKLGATAFGGNVALVAAIRQEIAERKKWVSDLEILDLMVVGNILPGPLATNVVFAIGKILHGISGAFVALGAVLLPSFVLMCFLSWAYFSIGLNAHVTAVMNGIIPCVAGIIAATAWNLLRKNVKGMLQYIIVVLAAAAMLLWSGFFLTLIVVAVAAVIGRIFMYAPREQKPELPAQSNGSIFILPLIVAALFGVLLLLPDFTAEFGKTKTVALTFGSMSVTLFGGGYVFVPAMEKVVVEQMMWMSSRQFSEGIALGHATPGPIMIASAFVGWKVSGFAGALAAALALFIPPAVLMYVAQHFMQKIKTNDGAEAAFKGVRPAVIGMITASVWVIFSTGTMSLASVAVFAVTAALCIWKNPEPILLILAAALAGWLIW